MRGRIRMIFKLSRIRTCYPFRAALTFVILSVGMLSGRTVQGARIHGHRLHASSVRTEDSLGPAWTRFLDGGPTLWSHVRPPRFPSGLVLTYQNGRIVDTPLVDYLSWRRSLNPARFDLVHPTIGPALGGLTPPTPAIIPAPGGITAGKPPTSSNPVPEIGVPEPSTLSLGLALGAVAYAWRYRRKLKE